MRYRFRNGQAAFSLIELSVVLAILAIITGSIFAFNKYMRDSQLKTSANQAFYYLTAAEQFRDNYGYLPGDVPSSAITFNGAAGYGNGNGLINGSMTAGSINEHFILFQHLRLAGLINSGGSFTGLAGPGGDYDAVVGTNLPEFAVTGLGGYIITGGILSGDASFFDGNYSVYLRQGLRVATNNYANGPFATPTEARNLDGKYDNGSPATGRIRSFKDAGNCVSGTAYNLSSSSPEKACALLYSPQ